MPENVPDESFGGNVVPDVQGRGVREGKRNRLTLADLRRVNVNVERDGADVRGVASTSLDELGDGSELVLRRGGRNVAGIQEEAEESRFSRCLSGDHKGVSVGRSVRPRSVGTVPRGEERLRGRSGVRGEGVVLGGHPVETVLLVTAGPLIDFVHGGRKKRSERTQRREIWLVVAWPWLAEATLCGALNSPAGLTFLSLRGAAPASIPEPFSTKSNPIPNINSFGALNPYRSRSSGIHFPAR